MCTRRCGPTTSTTATSTTWCRTARSVIVDEFTGRLMTGRRWSDGLHQAVEAKEGVQIQAENQTLASITFQNYFRMYGKLAGMTGTADTEAYEFQEIYGLETVVIPPNRPPSARTSSTSSTRPRAKSTTPRSRTSANATSAASRCWWAPRRSRTPSSSPAAEKAKLPHQVLNAKQHAKRGRDRGPGRRPAMITIATNMAGRGTDIVLGGNVEKQIQAWRPTRPGRLPPRRQRASSNCGRVAGTARGQVKAAGRPAHHRHRAAREPPHRQPAARPLGPPGRPGLVALLPEPGRPADAHLRRRPRARHHGPAEDARGRGHRGRHRHAQHRERAAQGRGAQLRHAQAAARIRRRQPTTSAR
jgi:hypothetical protein